MKHQYRVTLESIPQNPSEPPSAIQFTVENHDDIFGIVKKLEGRDDFSGDDVKPFAVGLKLFGEVMLKNREKPLFAHFLPHFVDFMKELKKG